MNNGTVSTRTADAFYRC